MASVREWLGIDSTPSGQGSVDNVGIGCGHSPGYGYLNGWGCGDGDEGGAGDLDGHGPGFPGTAEHSVVQGDNCTYGSDNGVGVGETKFNGTGNG